MTFRHATSLALFASFSFALMACSNKPKPQHHYTLLEVIDVKGTCYEDHVRQSDGYAGQIVRWSDDETKQIATYGSVTNTGDLVDRVLAEAKHPTVYQTPFIVEFEDIRIDTNQPKWTLHGISDTKHGEGDEQGYDSTCELAVTKRGRELPYGAKPSR
jgi:hypothetical protein